MFRIIGLLGLVILNGCMLFGSEPAFKKSQISGLTAWNNKMPFIEMPGSEAKRPLAHIKGTFDCTNLEEKISVKAFVNGDNPKQLFGDKQITCQKGKSVEFRFWSVSEFFEDPTKIKIGLSVGGKHKYFNYNISVKDVW